MGLQLPPRVSAPVKRVTSAAVLGLAVVLLSACSAEDKDQWKRLAMPTPATEQAPATFELWKWAWVAAAVVGVVVWGLIGYSALRFRRRSDDEVPVQTRYNLPLEIFYTIAPILMVIVFFQHTVNTQNTMLEMKDDPDVTVEVVGQQWQWTFNYGLGAQNPEFNLADVDPSVPPNQKTHVFRYNEYGYEVGNLNHRPTLWLPVDKTVQFNLYSPDVNHSFGVDSFLMKMDVIPGRVNAFQVKPNRIGTYAGKCFELCGTAHSRMIFDVKVVSQADYDAHVKSLATTDTPLIGGNEANTVAGLKTDKTEGGHE